MINNILFKAGISVLVLMYVGFEAFSQDVSIHFQSDPTQPLFGQVTVRLSGEWNEQIQDTNFDQKDYRHILSVYAGEEVPKDSQFPPVLGHYELTDEGLSFTPRFQPPPGMAYTIVFRQAVLGQRLNNAKWSLKEDQIKTVWVKEVNLVPETIVTAVYPAVREVPANLLKVYIYFSRPMSDADPYQHLKLITSEGTEIRDPFVEISEGLWDVSKTRLTVFFHPGRIKRGVGPNVKMGPVFGEGGEYRLVIDKAWKDSNGIPLREAYTKNFHIVASDRQKIRVENWRIDVPREGTKESLRVRFDELLDHALLERMLHVKDYMGAQVPGTIQLEEVDRIWAFTPESPWAAGDHELVVDRRLEDLAGNTLQDIFDREIQGEEEVKEVSGEFEHIPFSVRK